MGEQSNTFTLVGEQSNTFTLEGEQSNAYTLVGDQSNTFTLVGEQSNAYTLVGNQSNTFTPVGEQSNNQGICSGDGVRFGVSCMNLEYYGRQAFVSAGLSSWNIVRKHTSHYHVIALNMTNVSNNVDFKLVRA